MSKTTAWILYTLFRILFFAVPFTLLMFIFPESMYGGINLPLIVSALFSALISFSLSVLFLNNLREKINATFEKREKSKAPKVSDEEDEDKELGDV